ncbi:hypothetical protein M2401_003978 [Pseudomonas sp. JUb42]|nr:hypothetical protein [Pseudomonas sp. JUb42]
MKITLMVREFFMGSLFLLVLSIRAVMLYDL